MTVSPVVVLPVCPPAKEMNVTIYDLRGRLLRRYTGVLNRIDLRNESGISRAAFLVKVELRDVRAP